MVFSPLTARTASTRKYNDIGARRRVDRLIVHHTAGGSNADNVALLSGGAREVSATYCLLTTGRLVGIVPEQFRPWTSNAPGIDADWNSVTVETVNTGGSPAWPVSKKQVEALAQLAADLCRRYQWGTVTRSRVIGHQEVGVATACPGPFLLPRLGQIVTRANQILRGETAAEPEPIPEEDDMYKPTVHVRSQGNFEATRGHPLIGRDLKPGQSRKRAGGRVTVFPGYEVTANRRKAVAWARAHARGAGNETSITNRTGYIDIQEELEAIALELR